MSKPYRIRLQETVSATDSSTFHIDPLPLVAAAEFSQIMQAVLHEAGWSHTDGGQMQIQISPQERWVFHPSTMQITAEVRSSEALDHDFSGWSQETLQEQADKYKEAQEARLRSDIAETLEGRQEERRQSFEQIVVEATGRAIKHAASRMGDIHDIQESRSQDGRYALTITIHEKE